MADGPGLTQQQVERIEDVMDTYRRNMADGTITPEEHREFMDEIEALYQHALYTDESMGMGYTMMRVATRHRASRGE